MEDTRSGPSLTRNPQPGYSGERLCQPRDAEEPGPLYRYPHRVLCGVDEASRSMSHTIVKKEKLLNRVRRIRGRIESVAGARLGRGLQHRASAHRRRAGSDELAHVRRPRGTCKDARPDVEGAHQRRCRRRADRGREDVLEVSLGPELMLLGAVVSVGVLHTLVPDHWVPVAVVARNFIGRELKPLGPPPSQDSAIHSRRLPSASSSGSPASHWPCGSVISSRSWPGWPSSLLACGSPARHCWRCMQTASKTIRTKSTRVDSAAYARHCS